MKKMLKILCILLCAVLISSFAACAPDSGNTTDPEDNGTTPPLDDEYTYVDFSADDGSIAIDGVKETTYDTAEYTFGVQGRGKVYFKATKKGIYTFFDMIDNRLYYSNNTEELYTGDSVELFLDAANRSSASPNKYTRQLQIDAKGNYQMFEGDPTSATGFTSIYKSFDGVTTGDALSEDDFKIEVVATGDVAVLGTVKEAVDTGYKAEVFLSWELLGTDAKTVESNQYGPSGVVGVAFGHRDVVGVDEHSYMNDVANQTPNKYHKLKLVGTNKGVSVPSLTSEITIDGVMDEANWAAAEVIAGLEFASPREGTINGRAFFGENGLYIGVEVVGDTKLEAPYSIGGAVYYNDGLEFRIHLYDAADADIRSFKILIDLFGMQWHDTPAGSPGAIDELIAIKTTGTINDNTDSDTGWCVEMFIPNYELDFGSMVNGNIRPSDTDVAYAMIMAGVQNYNVDPTIGSVVIPETATWEKPETYIKIVR